MDQPETEKWCIIYNTAEPVVGSKATCEIIWVTRLLKENSEVEETSILYVDNDAPVKLVKNFEIPKRRRRIDLS